MRRRLLLFARSPVPGRVKTRLAPALGEEGASRLYEALLDDTVERLRAVEARLELMAAPGEGGPTWLRARYPGLPVRQQRGAGLGDRLANALADAFADGAAAAMVVGSDHPTLPAEHLSRGFLDLSRRDAVLGPGRDGGYYALGVRRRAWPAARALFRGIPWSTPDVARATREAAREADLDLGELPGWYDVDRPADLELLRRDASPHSRSLRALDRLQGGPEAPARRGSDTEAGT